MWKALTKPREFFGGLCFIDGMIYVFAGAVALGTLAALPYALV